MEDHAQLLRCKISRMVHTPDTVLKAIEKLVASVRTSELVAALDELSACYRTGAIGTAHQPWQRPHYLAYLVARLPATLAATRAVLDEVAHALDLSLCETFADVCAGPATALLAFTMHAAPPKHALLIERDAEFVGFARELLRHTTDTPGAIEFCLGDAERELASRPKSADLVVCSYGLGEQLTAAAQRSLVQAAWTCARRALVLIEPGTPVGTHAILESRSTLLEAGAHLVAPCPHTAKCPLSDLSDRWCHFSVRLARTRLHRLLKHGALGYEDERFAYLVALRAPAGVRDRLPPPSAGRILSRPRVTKAGIEFDACLRSGRAHQLLVPKRDKHAYRAARDLRWGNPLPESLLAASISRGDVR